MSRPSSFTSDLAQVRNDDDIEISLNGLLTDCDQEDRDGKLSSLWRTGLDPWDWTQDTVGPFRFLLPVFVFTALFRIGISMENGLVCWI